MASANGETVPIRRVFPQPARLSQGKQPGKGWGGRWELNPQRPEPQSGALPIELLPPYPVDCSTGLKECQKPDKRNGYTGARETSRAKEEIQFSRGQCQRTRIPWPATELNQGDS